jgi:hypothetical protein
MLATMQFPGCKLFLYFVLSVKVTADILYFSILLHSTLMYNRKLRRKCNLLFQFSVLLLLHYMFRPQLAIIRCITYVGEGRRTEIKGCTYDGVFYYTLLQVFNFYFPLVMFP